MEELGDKGGWDGCSGVGMRVGGFRKGCAMEWICVFKEGARKGWLSVLG